MIEFRNFIKARNEQWEEQCREQKRIELEEREARIEENRRAAEVEAREKERIMKQIRRAEMENERLEERDNHNAKDDNDVTIEAKADDFNTEEKGGKAKADNLTTEARGGKARADDLATGAKGGKTRTEEDSNRHEAATEMIHEQGEEFPFVIGREFPRNEIKMIVNQRTEAGIQTSETGQRMGEQWESQWRNTNW